MFGALPIFAKMVLLYMTKSRLSAYAAAQQAAAEYEYFTYMKDSEIQDVALALGQQTDIPYWEWFKALRTIQDLQASGVEPIPEQEPEPEKDKTAIFWVIGGFAAAILFARRL